MSKEGHFSPEQSDSDKKSEIEHIKRKLAMYYQYIADYYSGVRQRPKDAFPTNTAEAIKELERQLNELEK